MPTMRWRPGLRPGPRWGSSRRSPRTPSRLERGTPPPQEPLSLGASILAPLALDVRHLVFRCLISSVYPPLFLTIHRWTPCNLSVLLFGNISHKIQKYGRTNHYLLLPGLARGRQRGEKRRKIKKSSRENSDCKFHMCLRARKTKPYGQRVPIVSYYVDIT